MDYEIIEQFNTFWRNYHVDETLFPHRRAATLKLWIDKHPAAREAMLAEIEANGGPKGKNPYFFVQEFAEPEPTNYNGRRLKPGCDVCHRQIQRFVRHLHSRGGSGIRFGDKGKDDVSVTYAMVTRCE